MANPMPLKTGHLGHLSGVRCPPKAVGVAPPAYSPPYFKYRLMMFSSISCRPETFVRRVALLEHVRFQVLELRLARLDLGADAACPRRVALLDEIRRARRPCGSSAAILRPWANASMPPMWAWNRSTGSKLSRRTLASKLTPPGAEAALAEDDQHALRGQVNVRRELVGVPAEQQVAAVGVDASRACRASRRRPVRASSCGRPAWRGWSRC